MIEIDLGQIDSIPQLHKTLKDKLDFPDFYGNNWDAFWDAITGLVEMPNTLLFTNWTKFNLKFERDAIILKEIIRKFNSSELSAQIEYRND